MYRIRVIVPGGATRGCGSGMGTNSGVGTIMDVTAEAAGAIFVGDLPGYVGVGNGGCDRQREDQRARWASDARDH